MTDLRALLGDRYDDVIERVARTLFAIEEPDCNDWRWDRPNPGDPSGPIAWHSYWLEAAKSALGAAVLPDLLAAAWDEGHEAGHEDARAVQSTYPEPTPNPYRTEGDSR